MSAPRSDCSRSWPWVVGDGLFNNLETPVPARRLQAPQVVASGHVISCKSGEFTVRRPPPSDRVRRGRSRARNPGRHPGRTSSPSGRPSDCRTHPMRNLRRPIPGRLLARGISRCRLTIRLARCRVGCVRHRVGLGIGPSLGAALSSNESSAPSKSYWSCFPIRHPPPHGPAAASPASHRLSPCLSRHPTGPPPPHTSSRWSSTGRSP